MSDQNENQNKPVELPDVNAQTIARFEQLNAQSKKAAEEDARITASYHHSKEADRKADRAQIEASASEDRKIPKLDPLELIRQVEKMRKDGFDEGTIRAAFNEVMEQLTGNFRRPIRRVLKSEGMIRTLSQDEVNKLYTDHYKGITQDDPEVDSRVYIILDALEKSKQASNKILEYEKPTIKNYLFRGILAVVKGPLTFVINFLTAYKTAKYQSKHGVNRHSSWGSK